MTVKKFNRIISIALSFSQLYSLSSGICSFAIETEPVTSYINYTENAIDYIYNNQFSVYDLDYSNYGIVSEINNIVEYVNSENSLFLSEDSYSLMQSILYQSTDTVLSFNSLNIENYSRLLLSNELRNISTINTFVTFQNTDGGFGLAEGYTSDIIDSKLALKTLTEPSGEKVSSINPELSKTNEEGLVRNLNYYDLAESGVASSGK